MTPDEAKRTVVRYLLGSADIARSELDEACALANLDTEVRESLLRALDRDGDWETDCVRFRDRVAEFCTLTRAERVDIMPWAKAHAKTCASCREVYWFVRPNWDDYDKPDNAYDMPSSAKQLADRIRLTLNKAGELLQHGLGPPSFEVSAPSLALGSESEEGDPEPIVRRRWRLSDDEMDGVIVLTATAHRTNEIELFCQWESSESTSDISNVRMEVYDADDEALVHTSDVMGQPFFLPSGSWRLELQLAIDGVKRVWAVRFEFAPDTAERNL